MNSETQGYLAMYQTTQAYLRLAEPFTSHLGGLRWSSEDDALVYPDGRYLVFNAALAEFLEGLSTGGRVLPFGHALQWLELLTSPRKLGEREADRLREAFAEAGLPWHNAGAFAAALSADVPEVADPPRLDHVCRRLSDRAFPIRWFTARFHAAAGELPEQPALTPDEFERRVLARLKAYDDAELRDWLKTGRGPVKQAGEELARQRPLPLSPAGLLAALLRRPRLAGAETYVTQLVGALTLPPRRLAPEELPVGGYADMSTHGDVEQLLPSQHALDELEFLRRFAENELLYFRREEPPAQNRQELVVLLDQGVRTWGDVRLVLGAAALALGRQALARRVPYFLAGTSNGGRPLPLEEEAALGELIDASDLTLHPGLALESILERPSDALRDVVLLTHPRSLREPDVHAAARRLGPRDRLFAATLDEHGGAEVAQLRRGAAVKLRQFHVTFVSSAPPPKPAPEFAPPPWTGDVEPIGYPFRFGTDGGITHFAFDHDGRHLLTASGQGMLHLWPLDGRPFEVLPRPGCPLLKNYLGILGVAGGFLVYGQPAHTLFVAHYDLAARRCKIHSLPCSVDARHSPAWYLRDLHAVVCQVASHGLALDLTTGGLYTNRMVDDPLNRAKQAWDRWAQRKLPRPRNLHLSARQFGPAEAGAETLRCDLNPRTGEVELRGPGYEWGTFTPVADGQPLLLRCGIEKSQLESDVLALQVSGGPGSRLFLLQGPHGKLLREYGPWKTKRPRDFLLSPDGRWLALLRSDPRVEVEKIDEPDRRLTTRAGGFSADVRLHIGDRCLLLNLGVSQKHWHLIDWSRGVVEFHYETRPQPGAGLGLFNHPAFQAAFGRFAMVQATPAGVPQALRALDPHRYQAAYYWPGLWFVLDRFGQVAVLDRELKLIAMFMAFRDQCAAWLHDGSRCGSKVLGYGPDAAGARENIGAALLRAADREGQQQ